jgi:hypothetical protein
MVELPLFAWILSHEHAHLLAERVLLFVHHKVEVVTTSQLFTADVLTCGHSSGSELRVCRHRQRSLPRYASDAVGLVRSLPPTDANRCASFLKMKSLRLPPWSAPCLGRACCVD